jgi:hypothetical protein
VVAEERDNLLHDLMVESAASWNAMSLAWRVVLVAGLVGFVASNAVSPREVPAALLASLRAISLVLLVLGSIENARAADEFYQRVYLYACTYAFIASTLILYALFVFDVNLGVRSISVVVATFLVGFVVAFAVNRRG